MPVPVLFPFVGDSVGGSHISSTLLIENLDHRRYEPVVVLDRDGPLAKYLDARGVQYEFRSLPVLAGDSPSASRIMAAQLRSLPKMMSIVVGEKAGIVHTNDLRMHLTWSSVALTMRRRWFWHQRMLLSSLLAWAILGWAADETVCISNAVRSSLPVRYRSRANVLYNPVDTRSLSSGRTELRTELGMPQNTVVIGFVGNMVEQKRPLLFVEAAAIIAHSSQKDVRFVLIGDDRGGQLTRATALAKELGIANRTHFLGHRSPVEPLIASFDLLVSPGVGDGFGRTLVEAMIAETPVIASDSGGHREIITDSVNGWLVRPDDVEAFAAKTLLLLAEPDQRSRVAKKAAREAKVKFDPARHAQQVMAIYDRMLQ
jgi:glycosyltransferase involved in cell wall biosynthesis